MREIQTLEIVSLLTQAAALTECVCQGCVESKLGQMLGQGHYRSFISASQ